MRYDVNPASELFFAGGENEIASLPFTSDENSEQIKVITDGKFDAVAELLTDHTWSVKLKQPTQISHVFVYVAMECSEACGMSNI